MVNVFMFQEGTLSLSTVTLDSDTRIRDLPFYTPKIYKSDVTCVGGARLSDYSITPGSTLFARALRRPPRDCVDVVFATRAISHLPCPRHIPSKSIQCHVPPNCSIHVLKRFVASVFDIEPRWVLFSFLDQMLEDRFTLEDYNFISKGLVDCAVGVMDTDNLRVNFDRLGNNFSNITVPARYPAIALMSSVANRDFPMSGMSFAVRPTNEIVGGLQSIGQWAHHNAVSFGVYSMNDPIVIVRAGDDRNFIVEAGEKTTVYQIKVQLRDVIGVPIARQVLTVPNADPGEALPDGMALEQLGRPPKMLQLREQPPRDQILIVHADENVISISIQGPDDFIGDVSWTVAREISADMRDFELRIPGGLVADPDAALWKAGVSSSTCLLVIPEGEATVPVVLVSDIDHWEIELPLAATLETVKRVLEELWVGAFAPIRLFCNGEYLTNDRARIGELAIPPGSRIFVAPT
jgi:hypothetical protein